MKKITVEEFRERLNGLLGRDDRPVVVYSALWPIAKSFSALPAALSRVVLDVLLETVGPERTLLMPVFTDGFKDGRLDLDTEPGQSGMINNLLWKTPGARRTVSAFFSFVAHGPRAAEVSGLRPVDAWGRHSVYEWIEQTDAHLVVLGVPWSYCSFLHRIEWLARAPYRYPKLFSGEVIHEGKRIGLSEMLFVRSLEPLALNVWPNLDAILLSHGMKSHPVGHSHVAEIGARALISALMPVIRENPYAFVRSAEVLKEKFGLPSAQPVFSESHV